MMMSSRVESAIATPMPAPPLPSGANSGTAITMRIGRSTRPAIETIVIVHERSRIISASQSSTFA